MSRYFNDFWFLDSISKHFQNFLGIFYFYALILSSNVKFLISIIAMLIRVHLVSWPTMHNYLGDVPSWHILLISSFNWYKFNLDLFTYVRLNVFENRTYLFFELNLFILVEFYSSNYPFASLFQLFDPKVDCSSLTGKKAAHSTFNLLSFCRILSSFINERKRIKLVLNS